ncbi:hypothetical protein Tco_0385556 [Tanacetum coccineum]
MKLQMNEIMELIRKRYQIHEPPISFNELEGSDNDTETPPPPCLSAMDPTDTLSMRDEVISTTLARENDEFIKSNVNYLVPILRESEVTLVNTDLECSIDLPFGEDLDTLLLGDREFDFNPLRDVENLGRFIADDLILIPRISDEPIG